jgi:hypothetical protein
VRLKIKLAGVTPLICNRFHDEAAMAATDGSRGSSAGRDRGSPREIAEKKLYLDAQGKPCIIQPALMRSIVDGGVFFKVGKAQITTREKSTLYACLNIEAATVPIQHTQPWTVDTRAVVIPATRGRILTHRPMFNDWALTFEAELDTEIMGERLFREVVDAAGQRVGLGDFRPARKGPYGRFRVDAWEVLSVTPALMAAE